MGLKWLLLLISPLFLGCETHDDWFSIYAKIIVLLPGFFFNLKMIVWFICPARNLRLKVKYFGTKLSLSRSRFNTATSGGFSGVVNVFYLKSLTYNYSINN